MRPGSAQTLSLHRHSVAHAEAALAVWQRPKPSSEGRGSFYPQVGAPWKSCRVQNSRRPRATASFRYRLTAHAARSKREHLEIIGNAGFTDRRNGWISFENDAAAAVVAALEEAGYDVIVDGARGARTPLIEGH